MPNKIEAYQCPHCKVMYQTYQDAMDCEGAHLSWTTFGITEYTYRETSKFERMQVRSGDKPWLFPEKIIIESDDCEGTKAYYLLTETVRPNVIEE